MTAELQSILDSGNFDASPRSRAFLRFIVEETLAGRHSGLTQATIATRVFGRRDDFDATVDPVVRIQAGRLRRSLERYYLLASAGDAVRIELPRGAYVPRFRWAEAAAPGIVARPQAVEDGGGWPGLILDIQADAAPHFLQHLTLELGRYDDVHVVRRQELERLPRPVSQGRCFVLTGEVAQADGRARAAVRLMDSRTARQLWAEEYVDGPSSGDDFFTQSAGIVAARVASEQGLVAQSLWGDGQPVTTEESTYGALLRSYRFFFARDREEFLPTMAGLQRAVAREPSSVVAWVQLARMHVANSCFELTSKEDSLDEALACASTAAWLDPSSPRARAALAYALLSRNELEAGRSEAESGLALHPDSLVYRETLGWLLALLGDWKRGLEVVRTAMARNPYHLAIAYHAVWADGLRRGDLPQALDAALRCRDSFFFWRGLMQASCLGLLGRGSEAGGQVAEVLRTKPDLARRGRSLIGRWIKSPDLLERIIEGLARAGLELE